jgi:hypothetical protein
MTKPGRTFLIMLLLIALSVSPSFSQESGNLTKPQDRFGTYPAYRFNPYYNPFYDYKPPLRTSWVRKPPI